MPLAPLKPLGPGPARPAPAAPMISPPAAPPVVPEPAPPDPGPPTAVLEPVVYYDELPSRSLPDGTGRTNAGGVHCCHAVALIDGEVATTLYAYRTPGSHRAEVLTSVQHGPGKPRCWGRLGE